MAHTIHVSNELSDYVQGFLLKQRSQRHSPHTIKFYTWNLKRFLWYTEKYNLPTVLSEITPNDIRGFFVYLTESAHRWDSEAPSANKPLSPAGVHAFARTLRAFFHWACDEAGIDNPFRKVEMPKLSNEWHVDAYTDEEIMALFAACDKATPKYASRNRAIISVLFDTGLRASELLSLCVSNVDTQHGVLTVIGKGGKSRDVVLGEFGQGELWKYISLWNLRFSPQSPLFLSRTGDALTYSGLKYTLKMLATHSGITRLSIRAHLFRHTAATKMHRNGMRGSTLQKTMGHSSFEVTRRYYLDITQQDLIQEHKKYGPLDLMGEIPHSISHTSIKWPSGKKLVALTKEHGYSYAGRVVGVSGNAVKKRLKKLGLI